MSLKRSPVRLLAAGLCLTLLLPSALAVAYPEKEHLPVDFADMTYTGFDDNAIQAAFSRLIALKADGSLDREDPALRSQVEELYQTILREYDLLDTQYTLLSIHCDSDYTDRDAAQEYMDFADRLNRVQDQCFSAFALLADSPYSAVMEGDADPETIASFVDYEPMSDREAELLLREEELVQQYQQTISQTFTVTVDGREWTAADLDGDLSTQLAWDVQNALYQAENEAVGPIFLELAALRRELAQLAGYDSYIDYAYTELYGRDYTPRQAKKLCGAVKHYLTPLYEEIWSAAADDISALEDLPVPSTGELMDLLEPCMEDLHPELGETFRFLREHHLYDLDWSPTKQTMGYTVSLPAYGSAFIFDQPYRSFQDCSTLIHEFGHFNEAFHDAVHPLWSTFNIDVGEIHSQGLEVLFTEYAEELFPGDGDGFVWNTLLGMVESVLDGCLYEEFQAQIYADPDMTLEEMNRLFRDLSADYGYNYPDDQTQSWLWVEVSHTFQQPFYYISYATSALSALDLWLQAQEDREGAVETYMDLSALSMTLPYCWAMEEVGLRDVFQSASVMALSQGLQDALSDDFGRSLPAVAPKEEAPEDLFYFLVNLCSLLLPPLLVVVLVVSRLRKKRAAKDPLNEDRAPAASARDPYKDPWE